jgi:hypothetical protein
LSEWIAYDNVHGLPDRVALGTLAAVADLINCWSHKSKVKLADYLPRRRGVRRQTVAEMKDAMGAYRGKG